jgi:hypothetical protein
LMVLTLAAVVAAAVAIAASDSDIVRSFAGTIGFAAVGGSWCILRSGPSRPSS